MKQGPSRFRRVATACAAGTIALSFLSVLGLASPASAASVLTGTTLAASPAPTIRPNLANQAASNWTVNLTPGATGGSFQLSVKDFNEAATVNFDHVPTVTQTPTVNNAGFIISTVTPPSIAGGVLTVTYTDTAATLANQPIVITNVAYDVLGAAAGPVVVTGTDTDGGYSNSGTANNITPLSASLDGNNHPYDPSASNAAVSAAAFGSTLYATTTPVIGPGTTAAGAWELPLTGTGNSWASGDKIYITVARNNATNCQTAGSPDSVGFSAAPVVTAVATLNGATTTPTLTASLTQMGSCSSFSGINNVLVLTFTNSGTIGTGSTFDTFGHPYAAELTIFGVSYAVSSDVTAINQGNVAVSEGYNTVPTFGTSATPNHVPNDLLTSASSTTGATGSGTPPVAAPGGPSNANINVSSLTVVANKPSVTIQSNYTSSGASVTNAAISPITITEGAPGSLGGGVTGYECVSIFQVNGQLANWNATTNTPTATLGGGFTAGTVPVTVETTGTQTGPGTLEFQIPTASTTTPGTVALSGLAIDVTTTKGVLPNLQANLNYQGINAACQGAQTYTGGSPASPNFTIANVALRSFGQIQDATAGGLLQSFPPTCVNGVPNGTLAPAPGGNETAAVLVTNGSYQDALSASYLAGKLGTGILTTLTASVSTDALNALRVDGVTEVFVVGGPLVVSPADITQLQNTPAYSCGGLAQRTTVNGQPIDLVVQQIFGQTADATAADVATFSGVTALPGSPPGTAQFQAAYSGAYNDTTGSSGSGYSTAPDHAVTTAVLATDQSFQDAASASAIAYNSAFPLLLTPQGSLGPDAAAALTNDGIQQVIVMGGPVAISDNVLTQIEAMGISVLRIAGQDFTDTSQLLAQFELSSVVPVTQPHAGQKLGLDYGPVYGSGAYLIVARGDYYTDGIVASLVSGRFHTPIVLTWDPNNEGNPSGTNYLGKFLTSIGQGPYGADLGTPTDGTMNNLFIVGGPFAISNALETALGTSLNG